MRITHKTLSSFLLLFLFYNHNPHTSLAQPPPNTTGYTCTPTPTTTTCQTYAFFRATAPDFLNLSAVADLFSVSRRMISTPSNISSPTSPLIPNQSLLVPITCSCNSINSNTSLSFANLTYTIQKGDTFYYVSTFLFQNLTTFQSVMVVNPTLIPTQLEIGQIVPFPIFCKCPNRTQFQNKTNYLISYVFQPDDTIPSIASRFGSTPESILDVNGGKIKPFDTVFVPVSRTPNLTQPSIPPISPVRNEENENKGVNKGLGIGLGICGFFLVLVIGLWGYRESKWRKRKEKFEDEKRKMKGGKGIMMKDVEVNLMADVSDCLDKYKVFEFEELIEATDGFDSRWVIEGSVYKGCIDGELYAIKKMKWNAYEELKILQKVNHGNLVKLEGFCIQKEEANCYLIYEYVENGSLHSWLHGNTKEKLSWKTRLRIAIDVANVLQYIHEHTRPRVVHKDIKSSNILLDSNMRAKIANFGLAKSGCNAITMHIVGTQGYIAPEYLTDGVVSTKMDVFSFGVVLLELISGREAIDEEGKVLWGKVDGILEGGEERKVKRLRGFMDNVLLEESCTMDSVVNVLSLAVGCLHRDPLRRPSMVDIVYALCKSDDLFFDVSGDRFSPREVVAR